MKNFLAMLCLLGAVSQAQACSVRVITSSPQVKSMAPINFSKHNLLCERLRKENAALLISGDAGVLDGISIAWAVVGIVDKDGAIFTSSGSGSNTRIGAQGSMDEAGNLLVQVINESIRGMDLELAVTSLNRSRGQVKAVKK